ncbi:FMN-linked oxidoreductase [Mycena venus]|uniref:FMN-linked oxidoreductase n=1 Tax=Mycena venus TaxID=2733690 RepID=A0A8H6Z037_9AGAR|nr:FMN-linked oxidoreductase [Mycena venus]
MAASVPKLFQPANVGALHLKHRVVLAPLTRLRTPFPGHVPPLPMMKEYYTQRASTPGTLLFTEATFIAARAGGYPNVPGIWSEEQIAAWKEITDSVHAAGSYFFLQMWAIGRAANPKHLRKEDPSFPYISASDVKMKGTEETPRPLTVPEIKEYVELYAQAAKNALRAGFDGVEIHAANGYLIDQFIQDVSNKRTDEYGGSVENRCRFALEVVDAVTKAVGANRTGIRLSPWSAFQEMGMADPKPTFTYLVSQIKDSHPDFAYIHVIEPRIAGDKDHPGGDAEASNDFIRAIWAAPRTIISAGGYTRETALERAEEDGSSLIAFGRQFLANPDLPVRLMKNIPTNEPNRKTFYTKGPVGYTDYPFAGQDEAKAKA